MQAVVVALDDRQWMADLHAALGCKNADGFDQKRDFYNIAKYSDSNAVKLLIGNKSDLPRQVTVEEAEKFAMDHGMMYFEHSCKTGSREALLAKLQEAVDKYKLQSG